MSVVISQNWRRRKWKRRTRRVSLGLEGLEQRSCPSVLYDFDQISSISPSLGTPTSFGIGPSINESGNVAFVGNFNPSGSLSNSTLFVGDGNGFARNVTVERFFNGLVSINNSDQVLVQNLVAGTNPPITGLRRYDANRGDFETVALGGSFSGSNFSDVFAGASLNNANQAAFVVRQGTNTLELATGSRQTTFNTLTPTNQTSQLRPVVADDGQVVLRYGSQPTDPIRSDLMTTICRPPRRGISPPTSTSTAWE